MDAFISKGESDVPRQYRKEIIEVVSQSSRQNPDRFDALGLFQCQSQLSLLGLICSDDEDSCEAHDCESVTCAMKPLDAAIRQSHANIMRLYLLTRESACEGSLFGWNLSTLAVLELVITTPLRIRKVRSRRRPKHLANSLIGIDDSALVINNSDSHAHVVENRLKHLLGIKRQQRRHFRGFRPWLSQQTPHIQRHESSRLEEPTPNGYLKEGHW